MRVSQSEMQVPLMSIFPMHCLLCFISYVRGEDYKDIALFFLQYFQYEDETEKIEEYFLDILHHGCHHCSMLCAFCRDVSSSLYFFNRYSTYLHIFNLFPRSSVHYSIIGTTLKRVHRCFSSICTSNAWCMNRL